MVISHDTVWLDKNDIAKLFSVDRSGISRHINNIFKTGEVNRESNVQKMHIPNSDRPVELFSLDVILAVGYRVNSTKAIAFRQWVTPLKYAMKYENYKIMDLLVKYGADVAMRTDHGVTVLHWGSLLVKPKIIVRLIEKYNADVNVVDDYGYTPLMYAMAR